MVEVWWGAAWPVLPLSSPETHHGPGLPLEVLAGSEGTGLMVRAGGFEPPLPEGTRIFVPATAFAAPRREKRRVCGLDHPFAIAGPVFSRPQAPPVWPLHLPPTRKGRGLGSGFPEGQGSPNLRGSTSRVSPGALDYHMSDVHTCYDTHACD